MVFPGMIMYPKPATPAEAKEERSRLLWTSVGSIVAIVLLGLVVGAFLLFGWLAALITFVVVVVLIVLFVRLIIKSWWGQLS